MAFAVAIPSRALLEHRDLAFWMKRSLEELSELRANPSADAVHDLRVSLRRCRSLASAVEEIDPHADWQEMRDGARKLFRSMGELRDAQVAQDWLNKLRPEVDPLKVMLLGSLKQTQESALAKALHLAEKFDEERWAEMAKALHSRLRKIPADREAASCLALERLQEAHELHRRALRTERPAPWHDLRIALKRFRYTLELLAPTLHSKCIGSLKRVQDVLGDIHDLDMLGELAAQAEDAVTPELRQDWQARVENVRQERMQTYRQLALGGVSIWQDWLSSFPKLDWPEYAAARIAATRKAMDPKPRRSLAVSRIAAKLWAELHRCHAGPLFADQNEKRVVVAAARLSGIAYESKKKSRLKSARTFLLKSPVPPAWTFAEWERVAWCIRFQRGPEPSTGNKRFARLSVEQQAAIRNLAGVLRLAVAAQRSGAASGAAIKMDMLSQGLLLHVDGVEETPDVAARFTEAKHLLERSISKTILIQPTKAPELNTANEVVRPTSVVALR
jgi:CHAD domain-containing protein